MTERKRVTRVEDALDALIAGIQVEFNPEVPEHVPSATVWASGTEKEKAWLKQQHRLLAWVATAAKRERGRPKKAGRSIHGNRAAVAWLVYHHFMEKPLDEKVTCTQVIQAARNFEALNKVEPQDRLFPVGSRQIGNRDHLESSLSRGRKELGIGDDWESEICEKIWGDFPANDSD
jgi:hypothetical protein